MSLQDTTTRPAAGARTGRLLRLALKLDAVVTGICGVGFLLFSAVLDGTLGLPTAAMAAVGAFLIVYAGLVWTLATRPAMPVGAVYAVIAANALWAVDSAVLLALDGFTPTVAGQVVIAVQAAGVAAFAALQYLALRRDV
jgi:hypothetical protein